MIHDTINFSFNSSSEAVGSTPTDAPIDLGPLTGNQYCEIYFSQYLPEISYLSWIIRFLLYFLCGLNNPVLTNILSLSLFTINWYHVYNSRFLRFFRRACILLGYIAVFSSSSDLYIRFLDALYMNALRFSDDTDVKNLYMVARIFVLARDSTMADIETNPGPFEVVEFFHKLSSDPRYKTLETALSTKVIYQKGYLGEYAVSNERIVYRVNKFNFEIQSETIFGDTYGSSLGERVTDVMMFNDDRSFLGLEPSLRKLIITLTPMSNGGFKILIRRIFFSSTDLGVFDSYSGTQPTFPYALPLERGCTLVDHVTVFSKFDPQNVLATLQGIGFSSLNRAGDKASDLIDKIDSKITAGFDKLEDYMGSIPDYMKHSLVTIVFGVAVSGAISYYLYGDSLSWKCSVFGATILTIFKGPDLLNSVINFMNSRKGGNQEQGFDDILEFVKEPFIRFFDIKYSTFKKIFDLVSHGDKFVGGLIKILTAVLEIINKIAEYITDSRPVPDKWILGDLTKKEVLDACEEMDKFMSELDRGVIPMNHDAYRTAMSLQDKFHTLSFQKDAPNSILNYRLRKIDQVIDTLKATQPGISGTRVEPVAGLFMGRPGTMKTTWSNLIMSCLVDDSANNIYVRKCTTEFWDDYRGQEGTIFDDWGKNRDSMGNPNPEFGEIIDCVNTSPFLLRMASVENKGKVFFRSSYIMCTTNLRKISIESLIDKGAVTRRFTDLVFFVCPKSKHQKDTTAPSFDQVPDFETFPRDEHGVADIGIDSFEFRQVNLETQHETGVVYSAVELVQLFKARREKNIAMHNKTLESMKRMKSAMMDDLVEDDDISMEDLNKLMYLDDLDKVELVKSDVKPHGLNTYGRFKEFFEYYKANQLVNFDLDYFVSSCKKHLMSNRLAAIYAKGFNRQDYYRMCQANLVTIKSKCKITNLRDMIQDIFKEDYSYRNALLWTSLGCGLASTLVMALKFWKSIPAESQNYNAPVKASPKPWKPMERHIVATPQSDLDDNGRITQMSLLSKSQYMWLNSSRTIIIGYVTCIVGRWIVVPLHYILGFETECQKDPTKLDTAMFFRRCADVHVNVSDFAVTKREIILAPRIVADTARDVCLIELPFRFQIKKDIRSMFKSRKDYKETYDLVRRIIYKRAETKPHGLLIQEEIGSAHFTRNVRVMDKNGNGYNASVYQSTMYCRAGICGSLYFECNSSLQKGKIIGLHTSGNVELGFSFITQLCLEDFDKLKGFFEIDPLIEKTAETQGGELLDNQFECIGKAEPFSVVTKSTLVKSKIFGRITATDKAPARLNPFINADGEKVDPLKKGLQRFNSVQDIFLTLPEYEDLLSSEDDFYKSAHTRTTDNRVYTFKEAIVGLNDDVEFTSISRSTSPGYPYILNRKLKGRKDFFGEAEEFCLDTEKCRALFAEIETDIHNIIENNIVPEMLFVDNLKDECVPLAKVSIGKTRVFSGGNLKMLVMFRMYFGDFSNCYTKNRIINGSAIGVNPYSSDWNAIAERLLSKNDEVNAGDFSGFDTTQSCHVLELVGSIIEKHYINSTPEERKIRQYLWRRLIHSVHVVKGHIYIWDCALPSGNPLTALVNTMVNRIVHKICFVRMMGGERRYNWIFNDSVCHIALGDDVCFTVDKMYSRIFNEFNLGEEMAKLKMVYTPEDKTASFESASRKITDITFLKRKFRWCEYTGAYIGPMLLRPLLDQLNWTRKADGNSITLSKCEHVIRELSLHGQSVYEEYVPRIATVMKQFYGKYPYCTDFLMSLEETSNLECDYSTFETTMSPVKQNNRSDIDYPTRFRGGNDLKDNGTIVDSHEFESEMISAEFQMDLGNDASNSAADVVFQDNAVVDTVTTAGEIPMRKFQTSFTNSKMVDIERYLRKPVEMDSGELESTDASTTFSDNFWSRPLSIAMNAEKVKTVFSMKATLVVTLEVNANPMQQGRYILAYVPTGGVSRSASRTLWHRMHRHSITQIIQLNHVELDLACDTSVTLRIPWVSAYNSYIHNTSFNRNTEPGQFFMYPYEPIKSAGGSSNASYFLWAHYEDIELGVVGSIQGDGSLKGAVKSGIDFLYKEQQAGTKTVSRTLGTAADYLSYMAKIPVLNTFAAPLEWATRGLSMGVSSLGFSKPNLVCEPVRTVRNNFPYMATSDGVDGAEPLGMTISNHVSLDPQLLGTNLDEMSIAYIASKPGFIDSFTWRASANKDEIIFVDNIFLENFFTTTTDDTVQLKNLTPLAFLSRFFNFWRGSLCYTFKIIKTGFHSGRLLIAYTPFDSILNTTSGPAANIAGTASQYRNIVDIRENNEVTITVPFISVSPWAFTNMVNGYIAVYVLDPLKHPDVVSDEIEIKVEVRGGPDLAFAGPRNSEVNTTIPATFQGADDESPEECKFNATMIGSSIQPPTTLDAEETSMGESIPSMRHLLKRGGYMDKDYHQTNNVTEIIVLPYENEWSRVLAGTLVGNGLTIDPFSIFSSVYALQRGGIRLRAIPERVSVGNTILVALDNFNIGAGTLPTPITPTVATVETFISNNGNCANLAYFDSAPVSGIVIPQYTRQISAITAARFHTDSFSPDFTNGERCTVVARYMQVSSETDERFLFHRAGADDCTFGCFVSIPPVT